MDPTLIGNIGIGALVGAIVVAVSSHCILSRQIEEGRKLMRLEKVEKITLIIVNLLRNIDITSRSNGALQDIDTHLRSSHPESPDSISYDEFYDYRQQDMNSLLFKSSFLEDITILKSYILIFHPRLKMKIIQIEKNSLQLNPSYMFALQESENTDEVNKLINSVKSDLEILRDNILSTAYKMIH